MACRARFSVALVFFSIAKIQLGLWNIYLPGGGVVMRQCHRAELPNRLRDRSPLEY
jgi:hypothetical protein